MTIKTIEVPEAQAFHAAVAKIRKRSGCGTDPDGYFTYTEKTIGIPSKPSQYFLGEGDIEVLTNFLDPSQIFSQSYAKDELVSRRRFWSETIHSELYAGLELTAPITFWAINKFGDLFNENSEPIWDFKNYGEVSAPEFLESLTITGTAILSYRQLAFMRHNSTLIGTEFGDTIIPWIEQLPYADIFICNDRQYNSGVR